MTGDARARVLAQVRQRIARAVLTGAMRDGDRLPSTRELATELGTDPRAVAAAYAALAGEGRVVLKSRSGAFVVVPETPGAPLDREVRVLLQEAVRMGLRPTQLVRAVDRAFRGRELQAVAITTTVDQAVGIARELKDDFGLVVACVTSRQLEAQLVLPRAVRRAHVLVTTEHHARRVRDIGAHLHKPVVVATVREDLFGDEWRALLEGAAYIVGSDPRFLTLVRAFLDRSGYADRVRMLVVGEDDLSTIPPDAPTYITTSARTQLGRTRLPGRPIRPARVLDAETAVELLHIILEMNLEAAGRAE